MALNVLGLVSIVIFYVLILAIGIWAGRKSKSTEKNPDTEEVMLAGRNIGMVIGCFTMTATWVGGGYINGTAEIVFVSGGGLVWCQAPFCYAASLAIGGLFFAKKMREQGYVTMLDPFQKRYGNKVGALLYIPPLMGDLFWSAAILSALGATLSVIVGLENTTAIIVSACIAVVYTLFGGLYSVAYTDVIQLICIFIGLWLSVPFALTHHAVGDLGTSPSANESNWVGTIESFKSGIWLDNFLLLLCGGLPWQAYFQRVLSSKSAGRAKVLSFVGAAGCFFLAIPCVILGVAAKATDWNQTTYDGELPIQGKDVNLILPLVMQYLCPQAVAFIGLGAVSAAVMSSADSSALSVSTMFSENVYKNVFRPRASSREIIWVMRVAVVLAGAISATIGITVHSIYGLFYLCADLVYVILFPQLVCVVYLNFSNTYGSLAGYTLGLFFRVTGGEPLINFYPLLKFPYFDEDLGIQLFPFKTFSMLISLASIVFVSILVQFLFKSKKLDMKYDVLDCFAERPLDGKTNNAKGDGKEMDPVGQDPLLDDNVCVSNGGDTSPCAYSKLASKGSEI